MERLWTRIGAALAFIVVWGAPVVLGATDTQGISTQPPWELISLIALYGGVSVLAGFFTRLWALLLPVVLLVAVIPLDSEGEFPYEAGVIIYSIIVAYPGILLGLVTRWGWERRERRVAT